MNLFLYISVLLLFAQGNVFAQPEQKYEDILNNTLKSQSYEHKAEEAWDIRVDSVYGKAYVKSQEAEDWSKIEKDLPLESDDTIKTNPGANIVLSFDDKGIVRIEGNTEIELSSIKKSDSVLNLLKGGLVAKINHFLDKAFKFKVQTPTAVCAIRGTEFAVEYSSFNDETGVAVFDEGKVGVTPQHSNVEKFGGFEMIIKENTEIFLGPKIRKMKKAKLQRMVFHKSRLLEVRKKIKNLREEWKPLSEKRKLALRKKIIKQNLIHEGLRKKIRNKKLKKQSDITRTKRTRPDNPGW
ncbi:MAG: FecR family protein [Elusimicrobia bacterium]|nr:FecR family protein [Elusimicrobiota bacterium]